MIGKKIISSKDTDQNKHNKQGDLFYRYIVENLQSKITVLDKDGTILYQNHGFYNDDFYQPDSLVGKKFLEFVHPDYLQMATDLLNELIKNPGKVKQAQILFRYKDGSWYPLEIRAKSLLDKTGFEGIIVSSRDITQYKAVEDELKTRTAQLEREIEERKKVEEALKRSEEFFKTIVQNSYDSIVVVDEQGTRKYASSSFSNVGGYDPKEMLGKKVFDLVHPDDRERIFEFYKKVISDPGHTHSIQVRYLAKNGTYIWLEVLATNMLNNPIVNGIVLDSREITDRKNMEEELKRSEERFRKLVQNSADIIVIVDEKGRSKYISPSFEKITGYKIDERLGKSSTEFIHPDDIGAVKNTFSRIAGVPGKVYKGELRYLYSDGTYHWLEISAVNLFHDPNINGIVLTFRDISERKLSEQRLKEEMEITSQLLSLSEAISAITDENRLMLEAVKSSKRIIGCNIAVSYLWDKENAVFKPGEQVDLPDEILPLFRTENIDIKNINKFLDKKKPFLIRFSHSVLGDNIAVPIVDVEREEIRWFSLIDYIDLRDINALIVIPLINKDEWLGIIVGVYIKGKHASSRFTQRYYNAIVGIANQVSTALVQVKLYMESIEKTMELSHKIEVINTMYEIDRSILSNLTSKDVLPIVTRMAGKAIQCDSTAIMLVNNEKRVFNLIESPSANRRSSVETTISFNITNLTEVIKTGRPQYIPDLSEIKKLLPFEWGLLHNGFMSVMRIPLFIGDEIAGILVFNSRRVSAFKHEDLLIGEKLGSQISVALSNIKLITDLEESSISIIKSLSKAIDAKSEWTAGHSDAVVKYAIAIGKAMGLDEKTLQDLEIASILHDIGKIGIYSDILDKKEKLTEEEWQRIRQHPVQGVEIISPIKQLRHIIPIIKYHHEFFDGSGYPEGLKGEQIPLLARIISVADAVDAMSSDRPYRKSMSKEEIIKELRRCSGSQFDPEIVNVFLSTDVF